MYNSNTDSLGLILGVEVFLLVTVQEHCGFYYENLRRDSMIHIKGIE